MGRGIERERAHVQRTKRDSRVSFLRTCLHTNTIDKSDWKTERNATGTWTESKINATKESNQTITVRNMRTITWLSHYNTPFLLLE